MREKKGSPSVLGRIISLLSPYRVWIGLTLMCSVAVVYFTLLLPVYLGEAVDAIAAEGGVDFERLISILRSMAVAIAVTAVCQWLAGRINNHIVYGVTRTLRQQAFDTMLRLPISKIDSHPHGDYVSRIANDADTFSDGLLIGFTQLFSGVLTIVGVIVFMLRLDTRLALIVILLTPLSIFVARFISTRSYKMFSRQAADRGSITDMMTEAVWGGSLIHAFSDEEEVRERFDAENARLMESSRLATFYSSLTNPSTRFINSLIYTGIAIFGALSCINGGITVGVLTSFLSYAREYAKPFNEITGVITEMQNAFACAGRLFELIDETVEVDAAEVSRYGQNNDSQTDGGLDIDGDAQAAIASPAPEGHIEFRDVCFSYDKSTPLIEHVNIDARSGMRIAIVGPTGSGKTTLINLLMRFYDIDSGSITIDGTDIRRLPREALRERLGMVLQETWLSSGSIIDNLRMGRPDATYDEVVAACEAAHAHGFISRLPDGYDTVLSSGGDSISQGQRQLLCIARLMLALPPILILDEATSSIDTRTEMRIQDAFSRMMSGRTSFVVAHRLSTIRRSDLILYMEAGNVVEQGTHESLLAMNGRYAALYRSQFEGR